MNVRQYARDNNLGNRIKTISQSDKILYRQFD